MSNGHQTWQGDDLLFEASTNKISQSWSMWSSEDEWQIENIYLTNTLPMATKLGRVMTYRGGAPSHKATWPFNHVILQDHVENKKMFYLHYHYAHKH